MTVMEKRCPHPGLVVWVPRRLHDTDELVYHPVLCNDTDEVLETIVAAGAENFNDLVVTREQPWKLIVG